MRYLCLGYHEEKTWQTMSDDERKSILEDNNAYQDFLRTGGHVVDTKALEGVRSAATLRFDDGGKVIVTDGPFTETKEQLGGLMVLEAKDLNHAISLMSKMPCMRVGGSIEIRPINENIR
jgi:hypothetical protein